ncbi:MAG: alkaline phosphatase family protein [Thermoplasmata archaeon]|nr:alkaline phosphatase family protein [Thermoplasmata archaeon]
MPSYQNGTTEQGNPVTQKVVLVVVDGLRYDVSCKMNFVNSLREEGSDFVSWTVIPSLSYAGWSALLTGAKPEITGKVLNWGDVKLYSENLFSITREGGRGNAVVGCPDWWALLGDNITGGEIVHGSGDFVSADLEVKNAALRLLRNPPALTLIHFLSVDTAGHMYGGNSEEYLFRAKEIDGYIKEIASMLDWNTTTLIVTSDHGHRDAGGHGGEEILSLKSFAVFFGKGIKKAKGEVNQIDICPTISNLLGVKIPSLAQGKIIFECLNQGQENQAVYAYLLMKQRYFFAKAYLDTTGSKIQLDSTFLNTAYSEILAGNFSAGEEISRKGLGNYDSVIEEARARKIFDQRMNVGVFSFTGVMMSFWLLAVMIGRERIKLRQLVVPWLIGGAIVFIYFSIFFMIGMEFSFSVFNETIDVLRAILISFFVPGLLLFLGVGLYGLIGQNRMQHAQLDIRTVGLAIYCFILTFFSLLIGVNGVICGFFFTDFVIHLDAFMRVFLGGFICAGLLMYLGAALPLLEWMQGRTLRGL